MVVALRYIDSNNNICEDFVGFVDVPQTTGFTLASNLLRYLANLGLDKSNMVAQGYDGAANMSGKHSGIQALIREACPSAIYIHCTSHCLNLALSKSADIKEIKAAVTSIFDACFYFKYSGPRVAQLKSQIEKFCPQSRITCLKQYSATRWVERHDSIFIFFELYHPLLKVFNDRKEYALVNAITDPGFIIAALVLKKVLGLTKVLSQLLQSKQLDMYAAIGEIESITGILNTWRSDETDHEFNCVFAEAETLYQKLEDNSFASIPKPRLAGRQTHRNNVPGETANQYYKRAVWYPFLDTMISELSSRFNDHAKTAFKISLILPKTCTTVKFEDVRESFDLYSAFLVDSLDVCESEFGRWQRKWIAINSSERPSSIRESLDEYAPELYPNISILLKIFLTIPVTTATCERSFSALRLLKTYLRSTMGEERLNGLALLAVHKDITFKYDDVLNTYALRHNTRFRFN